MTTTKVYLLESRWSWDHSHTEIATITREGGKGYEEMNEEELRTVLQSLKEIAEAQNGNTQAPITLVALWRVHALILPRSDSYQRELIADCQLIFTFEHERIRKHRIDPILVSTIGSVAPGCEY